MDAANQPPPPQGEGIDPEKLTFLWGTAPLPFSDTPANFLVTGGILSGKTITLRLLMQSALNPVGLGFDHRAVVYDAKGDMDSVLRGMNLRCPVHILNPFARPGAAWDIAADITTPLAARQLATSLIPEDMSTRSFFTDAARKTLAAVCQSFIKTAPGKWTLRDVLLAMQTRERLLSLLARALQISTATQLRLNEEQTCANILATIATKLTPFEVIADCWHHATEKLSLERWLRNESVILLGDNPLFHDSLSLINQAILGCLAHLIFRQQDSTARRTWFFFDEVSEVGRLDVLPALLERGRSKGVCVALSFRRIEEIRGLYGSPVAEELTAACSHKTALRTDDFETSAWAEREFGPLVQASDLMSLPLAGPKHGFAGFHRTPKAGTYFAHKSWGWVLANLQIPKDATSDQYLRPESDHHLQDWTKADYQRLGFGDSPPPGLNASPKRR